MPPSDEEKGPDKMDMSWLTPDMAAWLVGLLRAEMGKIMILDHLISDLCPFQYCKRSNVIVLDHILSDVAHLCYRGAKQDEAKANSSSEPMAKKPRMK